MTPARVEVINPDKPEKKQVEGRATVGGPGTRLHRTADFRDVSGAHVRVKHEDRGRDTVDVTVVSRGERKEGKGRRAVYRPVSAEVTVARVNSGDKRDVEIQTTLGRRIIRINHE